MSSRQVHNYYRDHPLKTALIYIAVRANKCVPIEKDETNTNR